MANRKLLKRMIPIFYSISVHVIKSNAARIDRQDDRKGLIAVDIDRLFGVAILDLKLLHLLLIHGNQCALISTLCGELCNSFLDLREFSARAEEISEGKSRAIDIDGKVWSLMSCG